MLRADSIKTKIITKAMTFFVIVVLFFNCAFAGIAGSIKADGVAEVQKDIFSAVMFVSEAISKISMNLSEKIYPYAKTASKTSEDKQKKEETAPVKDFILISQTQNIKQLKDLSVYTVLKSQISEQKGFVLKSWSALRVDRSIALIFLMLMIFFIFTKKPYDDAVIYKLNNIKKV